MAKKKAKRTKKAASLSASALAAVTFRPGRVLGQQIDELAAKWDVTRGECCKRICALWVRDLSTDFYGVVKELRGCMYGHASFDEAAHLIYVAIEQEEAKLRKTSKGKQGLDENGKLDSANEWLRGYRVLHGLHKATQEKRKKL